MTNQIVTPAQVLQARRDYPNDRLRDLGARLGISGERVRQVLIKAGVETGDGRQKHYCLQCGKRVPKDRKFCDLECRHTYHSPLVACLECGKLVHKKLSQILITDYDFCSKSHRTKWVQRNIIQPNRRRRADERKA